MSSGEVLFAFACNDCSLADTVLWDGFLLSLKTYSHHHWSSAAGSADTSGLVTAAGVLLLAAPFFLGPVLLVGCATAGVSGAAVLEVAL